MLDEKTLHRIGYGVIGYTRDGQRDHSTKNGINIRKMDDLLDILGYFYDWKIISIWRIRETKNVSVTQPTDFYHCHIDNDKHAMYLVNMQKLCQIFKNPMIFFVIIIIYRKHLHTDTARLRLCATLYSQLSHSIRSTSFTIGVSTQHFRPINKHAEDTLRILS